MTNKNYVHTSKFFYGNEVSNYGKEYGRVDYATLAKAFDCVLNNDIIAETSAADFYWEPYNGNEHYYENEHGDIMTEEEFYDAGEPDGWQEYYSSIYQYYIISDRGAEILAELTDEIVFYCEKLDMYVWGVTHWGTAWDYVLTNIKLELN